MKKVQLGYNLYPITPPNLECMEFMLGVTNPISVLMRNFILYRIPRPILTALYFKTAEE